MSHELDMHNLSTDLKDPLGQAGPIITRVQVSHLLSNWLYTFSGQCYVADHWPSSSHCGILNNAGTFRHEVSDQRQSTAVCVCVLEVDSARNNAKCFLCAKHICDSVRYRGRFKIQLQVAVIPAWKLYLWVTQRQQ